MNRFGLLLIMCSLMPACGGEDTKKDPQAESAKEKKPKKAKKKKSAKKKKPRKKKAKTIALAREVPKTRLKKVPTPEDLEDEANRTVAMENLESELDRLEAEIIGVAN